VSEKDLPCGFDYLPGSFAKLMGLLHAHDGSRDSQAGLVEQVASLEHDKFTVQKREAAVRALEAAN
jgi:hypothetical protein